MASISKVIMVATVVMVISLAVIIALVLVLLAELYCSLLLTRRRQHRLSSSANRLSVSPSTLQGLPSSPQPLRSLIYSQGVLRAPRSLLFPSVPAGDRLGDTADIENQHLQLLHLLKPIDKTTSAVATARTIQDGEDEEDAPVSRFSEIEARESSELEDLVYISNPMYDDNDACRERAGVAPVVDTPFETPETSPSNLGNISGEELEVNKDESDNTPPLTPMIVPEKACSVSMKVGRFPASSGSESSCKNDASSSSSSSTGTPCTSPSW